MEANKLPGPDGFTAGFYKTMQEEIVFKKKNYESSSERKEILDTWKMAGIVMIKKENQDILHVRNYRPTSLLNNDYKLFSNILANRFKEFLKDWIGEEQTGFLPNRYMKDNVRNILDIIEFYETNHQKELALISLDAEKAFDNLNWDF